MAEITAITKAAERRGLARVNIELDGEAWLTCSATVVSEFRLFDGRLLGADDLDAVRERVLASEAMADCASAVSRRALTERELADRLHARGHGPEIVADALERSRHLGLVDDVRYAAGYVASRMGRGLGPRRIATDLARRGIDRAIVEEALAHAREAAGASATPALDALRRRFATAGLDDPKQLARAQRFLVSRGFGYDEVGPAIAALRDEQQASRSAR